MAIQGLGFSASIGSTRRPADPMGQNSPPSADGEHSRLHDFADLSGEVLGDVAKVAGKVAGSAFKSLISSLGH